MDDLYSPRPSKTHASETDLFGVVLDEDEDTTPIGYRWLHAFCASKAVLPRYSTFVTPNFSPTKLYHVSQNVLSSADTPKIDTVLGNMIWAIENEGVELQILKVSMLNGNTVLATELKRSDRIVRYSSSFRRIWFLYEYWTGTRVDIPDCSSNVDSVLILDPEKYVSGPCWKLEERQRVYNNLFGTREFHPFARKSLIGNTIWVRKALEIRTSELSMNTRQRAASYMRYKETLSSFEIEDEVDKVSEARSWCKLLRQVKSLPLNSERGTLSVAASLFPEDKGEYTSWRNEEIFIGQTCGAKDGTVSEIIHHIGAKASDINALMHGFYSTMNNCLSFAKHDFSKYHPLLNQNHQQFDPISVIALLTFSFTIIHPLIDGNGRSHRLLIHYLLEQFDILNSWLVPVSIIILHDNLRTQAKDKVLKQISDPIIRRTKYRFEGGKLIIENTTKVFFECWDGASAVEYMYRLLAKSARLSIDCGLYIEIWDRCLAELDKMETNLSHTHLKTIIGRYLQSGNVSKNTLKQVAKHGITEEVVLRIASVCEMFLKDDPLAFKEHFEPFNLNNIAELEAAYESMPLFEDDGYKSV